MFVVVVVVNRRHFKFATQHQFQQQPQRILSEMYKVLFLFTSILVTTLAQVQVQYVNVTVVEKGTPIVREY